MRGVRGIIWCKSIETGVKMLKNVIWQYELLGFTYENIVWSGNEASCRFGNDDIWEVIIAEEDYIRFCNISYIEHGIDKKIIDNIIIPSTIGIPFQAISYF